MKLILLSVVLSSLTLLQGCASTDASRDPSSSACHDTSTNSEDHHLNHCDIDQGHYDNSVRHDP